MRHQRFIKSMPGILRVATRAAASVLIINNSDDLLTLRRFHYASDSSLSVGSPLMAFVLPWEQVVIEGHIDSIKNEGVAPPDTMASANPVDMLDILYRSAKPYDPGLQGTREQLEAQINP